MLTLLWNCRHLQLADQRLLCDFGRLDTLLQWEARHGHTLAEALPRYGFARWSDTYMHTCVQRRRGWTVSCSAALEERLHQQHPPGQQPN